MLISQTAINFSATDNPGSQPKRLFLIDGSALFYRSYFAFIRNPLINSKGINTSAAYGFANSILKILTDEKPDYMAVVFDTSEPTFRHKKYKEYKATREKMPDEMKAQYPNIVELVKGFNIPLLEMDGYEADDIIGTLAKKAEADGVQTMMVTGDKDFMQLLSSLVNMYSIRPGKDVEIIDPEGLKEKLGLLPPQVRDYLALMGDSSDNVPGVPKVGQKTALDLIKEFNSLDNIYENIEKISKPALKKNLQDFKDQAYLSLDLVTIDTDVPVIVDEKSLKVENPDTEKLVALCREMEFNTLQTRIVEYAGGTIAQEKSFQTTNQKYLLVDSEKKLEDLAASLKKQSFFVFDTETTGLNPFDSDIVGFSFSLKAHEANYLPMENQEKNLTSDRVISTLKPIFENPKIKKGAQNIKFDGLMLWRHGIDLKGISFDTMIADYLINPGTRQHNLDNLARHYLHYHMIPIEELIGKKGKKQKSMLDVPLEEICDYAAEDADITFQLKEILEQKLEETETRNLFDDVEMPLSGVLMEMEKNGVSLDEKFLGRMSVELEEELKKLEKQIYEMADEEFNINSPQQLGIILFEKLEIHKELGNRRPTRTPTGQYSTSESVLEKFSEHKLVGSLLEYRKLIKLKSTYVDALPKLISKRTGRLHTSFNQTVAATGRLSSSDPNLQNIPIRTEIGRKIRRAFLASNPADLILSADYSQIELRIMAHQSADESLLNAFKRGEDIHTTTAAAIFSLDPEDVTSDHRRKAKEVNFGIIYGISPYGLASRLKIKPDEAEQIIFNYFARFPKVNDYIIHVLGFVNKNKYVTTILNRRRYIPEIDSTNGNIRQNAERAAINTTIQGSAADLIKLAMIDIHREFKKLNLQTKMILQVHDELVFEVVKDELETVKPLVKNKMENAMPLKVAIKVDLGVGNNWLEAH
jgi:DNA polymerase-1